MSEFEDDSEDDELTWEQIGVTAEGYTIYECRERPGIQRIAVPSDIWRKFYKGTISWLR